MYSYAWETQDGQKWLAKALDPAGMQSVDLKGLPDQESHNVVVLNYQSQYAVEPPQMYNAVANDASTYEAEMFFFQDPIVFGTAASYPTGTVDPLSGTQKKISINFGCTASGKTHAPEISFPTTTGILFPRTARRFVNSQLAGNTTITGAYQNLKSFAQRHRIIYGAAQLVPTCSMQDNSGTISVSQAPFIGDSYNDVSLQGRETSDMADVTQDLAQYTQTRNGLSVYYPNDFPDTEDNIRNPASLLTRFYEGSYIPYKLKNPFHEDFINTADARVTAAPFWTIGAAYQKVGEDFFTEMEWDSIGRVFTSSIQPGGSRLNVDCQRIKLRLMSRTGAIKEIVFVNNQTITPGTTGCYTLTGYDLGLNAMLSGISGDAMNLLADNDSPKLSNGQFALDGTLEVDASSPPKPVYHCKIFRTGTEDDPRARLPATNVAACLCKSMNMKGNITLLFRLGMEIIVTGASTYSPFNHKSPAYDESAIKSYLRVIHHLSDAFYGNAATEYFHSSYYNHILGLLYKPDETVDYANRGSYWRGVVSATR